MRLTKRNRSEVNPTTPQLSLPYVPLTKQGLNLFFFFDRQKHKDILEKGAWKATRSIQGVYKRHLKQTTKTQALTGPQQEPNQSTKLNKDKGPTTIEELAQDKRLQTNEFFNLWVDQVSLSKTILFLSFQTVQNKQRGAARQTFLWFLSLKETQARP